jgi:hypothetical protein
LILTLLATPACANDPELHRESPSLAEKSPALDAPEGAKPAPALSPIAQYTESLLQKAVTSRAKLTLVFVLDGMRPDLINPTDTPNLHPLREGGVSFANGHSVFPTVTRLNSPSIATECTPDTRASSATAASFPRSIPRVI